MLLSERYVGLMSGTSCDGVDAVVADFRGERMTTLAHAHRPFPNALRDALQALMQSGAEEIERMGDASVALAREYAQATRDVLDRAKLTAGDVAAIGAHGQTIRHRPERGFTLQINQPALLAELTGIAVVADFRSRDVAAGGQGAPLVPAFHAAVFAGNAPRAVVNIGGIANVSLLVPKQSGRAVRGFDTGPGNTLLDGWCARHRGEPFDRDGGWGASGTIDEALLASLLSEPYFAKPPPKSSGRELFHLAWLDARLATHGAVRPEDVQATLLALTCRSIADALAIHQPECERIFVCGGGALNGALMKQLASYTQVPVSTTHELGVDPMQVEALAFAWLARECFAMRPGNLPAVTGASGPRVLGATYPA